MIRYAGVVAVALAISPACGDGSESASSDAGAHPSAEDMREQLEQKLNATSSADALEVTYDDMHAFHGGETLTATGDTLRTRYFFPGDASPRQIEPSPIIMTAQQVRTLVRLLLELEAWEQRVPDREAVLDESVATLSMRIGSIESYIWEWYNDLSANDRIIRVKQLLEKFAGPAPEEPLEREPSAG